MIVTIIYNQSAADYFKIEALSASGAKLLNRSAAHYLYEKANPSKPSAAQMFGTLVHSLVLEPETVNALYAASPKFDKRTNAGKAGFAEFEAANAGKTIIDLDDYQRAQRCATAVLDHPTAGALLALAQHREVTVLFERYGVQCKARLDAIFDSTVLDLKTTRDASPQGFARSCAAYQYHAQATHYIYAAEESGLIREDTEDRFFFIAVESLEPHNVAVYELTAADHFAGHQLMVKAAKVYQSLANPHQWRGYPEAVTTIALPWNGGFDAE